MTILTLSEYCQPISLLGAKGKNHYIQSKISELHRSPESETEDIQSKWLKGSYLPWKCYWHWSKTCSDKNKQSKKYLQPDSNTASIDLISHHCPTVLNSWLAVALFCLTYHGQINLLEQILSILHSKELIWKTFRYQISGKEERRAVPENWVKQCKKIFIWQWSIADFIFYEVQLGIPPWLSCFQNFLRIWRRLREQVSTIIYTKESEFKLRYFTGSNTYQILMRYYVMNINYEHMTISNLRKIGNKLFFKKDYQ